MAEAARLPCHTSERRLACRVSFRFGVGHVAGGLLPLSAERRRYQHRAESAADILHFSRDQISFSFRWLSMGASSACPMDLCFGRTPGAGWPDHGSWIMVSSLRFNGISYLGLPFRGRIHQDLLAKPLLPGNVAQ